MSTSQPHEGANRPVPHQPALTGASTGALPADGPEAWVPEAIAEQEEYLKRWHSCMDTLGRSHAYADMHTDGAAVYRACTVCGVTETREDYATKMMAGTPT